MKDVMQGLRKSVGAARKSGVGKSQIILDPGVGFGKSFGAKLRIAAKTPAARGARLSALGGHFAARASLARTLAREEKPAPPEERIWGTAAQLPRAS